MRILNPGCGECVDRITILQLKIDAAQVKSISSEHFDSEKTGIENYVSRTFPSAFLANKIGKYVELNLQLAEVNKNLWKLEDEIRALKEKHACDGWSDLDTQRTIEVAFLIPSENDKRASLVREINAYVTDQDIPNEKLYS